MREAAPKFRERGARIAVVGQGPAEGMAEFCESHHVSDAFVCLADPERAAYDAFGLTRRGDLGDVMGPKILAAGIKALRFGVSLPGKGQDMRQLGGAFVIDREGGIRFAQRAATAADRATVDSLLSALP